MSQDPALEVCEISRWFGGVKAVEQVSLEVPRGSITSLIGPNGAGKTTLFNVITCIFPATRGEVSFNRPDGARLSLDGLRPDQIACQGIARTFQNIRLFGELTALENVKLGTHAPTERQRPLDRVLHLGGVVQRRAPWLKWALVCAAAAAAYLLARHDTDRRLAALVFWFLCFTVSPLALASLGISLLGLLESLREALPLPRTTREEQEITRAALAYLEFVGLLERADLVAGELAYGDQRRLEIARALACQPSLLLLDEPAAGMNPQETERLMALIEKIRRAGITVLLIEHDMKLVMRISDLVYVLDHGELIASGDPASVSSNPRVIEAYLGVAQE